WRCATARFMPRELRRERYDKTVPLCPLAEGNYRGGYSGHCGHHYRSAVVAVHGDDERLSGRGSYDLAAGGAGEPLLSAAQRRAVVVPVWSRPLTRRGAGCAGGSLTFFRATLPW